MALAPSLNTIFEPPPIVLPPEVSYGKNIVFIGTSKAGQYMVPIYVGSYRQAQDGFSEGELVDAYEEAYGAGARYVYLVRINKDDDPEILSQDVLYDRMVQALDVLADYSMHIIVPLGVYFDDSSGYDYASLFADFCLGKSSYGESIVVLNARAFERDIEVTSAQVDARVTELYKSQIARRNLGPSGSFLNVVFSEVQVFGDTDRKRYVPGASLYAGLLSYLPAGYSPVNKSIPVAEKLRYHLAQDLVRVENNIELSHVPFLLERRPLNTVRVVKADDPSVVYTEGSDYMVDYNAGTVVLTDGTLISSLVQISYLYNDYDSLASVGIVTFMDFVRAGIAPASSVTMAKDPMKMVNEVRILQDIAWCARTLGEELVGTIRADLSRMQEGLDGYLNYLVSTYQLQSYDFDLSFTDNELLVYITVVLRGSVMLQEMQIRVPLRSQ